MVLLLPCRVPRHPMLRLRRVLSPVLCPLICLPVRLLGRQPIVHQVSPLHLRLVDRLSFLVVLRLPGLRTSPLISPVFIRQPLRQVGLRLVQVVPPLSIRQYHRLRKRFPRLSPCHRYPHRLMCQLACPLLSLRVAQRILPVAVRVEALPLVLPRVLLRVRAERQQLDRLVDLVVRHRLGPVPIRHVLLRGLPLEGQRVVQLTSLAPLQVLARQIFQPMIRVIVRQSRHP